MRRSQVRYDIFLTGSLVGIKNANYVADEVFTPISVSDETGLIPRMGEDHYDVDFDERALGALPQEVDWSPDTPVQYRAQEYVLKTGLDWRLTAQGAAKPPFNMRRETALNLSEKLRLRKELMVAGLVMTPGNYPAGNVNAVSLPWTDPDSNPIDDIQGAVGRIVDDWGISEENLYGLVAHKGIRALRSHPKVRESHLNTTPGRSDVSHISVADIASAVGLKAITVGSAVMRPKGLPSVRVWSETQFLVYYKPPNAGIMVPALGYTIRPQIQGVPSGADVGISQYDDRPSRSTVIEADMLLDNVLTKNDLGQLLTGIVA